MIKEILQENINKSLSKEKINCNKLNSVLYGLDTFKKLKLLKKSKQIQNRKRNNNLKLLLNKNENLYVKKVTNLKTSSVNKSNTNRDKINININLDKTNHIEKRTNHTSREILRNRKFLIEETKSGNICEKNLYISGKININYNKINNLDKEFEIRRLKKKLENLKLNKDSLKQKLENIKEKNNRLKYEKIKRQDNYSNILYS